MKRRKEAGYANSFRYLTKKEEEALMTEGRGCKAFPECENTPGEDGYCDNHRPRRTRRKQKGMTPEELRRHGLDVTISRGGTVVRRKDLNKEDEAFRETLPKGND